MGPNCNGLINFVDAFALTSTATIKGPRRPAGDIGVASQSGGAGQVNVMWRAQHPSGCLLLISSSLHDRLRWKVRVLESSTQ